MVAGSSIGLRDSPLGTHGGLLDSVMNQADRVVVGQHVPQAVAGHDQERVIGLQLVFCDFRLCGDAFVLQVGVAKPPE